MLKNQNHRRDCNRECIPLVDIMVYSIRALGNFRGIMVTKPKAQGKGKIQVKHTVWANKQSKYKQF